MMKMSKLLKTRFATVVKTAIEAGELTEWNVYSWTTAYNSGMPDKALRDEVYALINHFNN